MISNDSFAARFGLSFAVLCTALLLFNMAAIFLFKEQLFLQNATAGARLEIVILTGFALVLMFNIVSILLLSWRLRTYKSGHRSDVAALTLGVVCLALMLGAKAMTDEIGREFSQGSHVIGEFVVLYVCLIVQLTYNIVISHRVYRSFAMQRSSMTKKIT